jgi:hypothetical protein
MMKPLRSFETSVLTRATRRNIPEDLILEMYELGHVIRGLNFSACGQTVRRLIHGEISDKHNLKRAMTFDL